MVILAILGMELIYVANVSAQACGIPIFNSIRMVTPQRATLLGHAEADTCPKSTRGWALMSHVGAMCFLCVGVHLHATPAFSLPALSSLR